MFPVQSPRSRHAQLRYTRRAVYIRHVNTVVYSSTSNPAPPVRTGHLRHVIRAMCPGALRCEVNGVDRAGSEMGTEINEIDHVLAALRWVRIQSHKPVSKGSRLAQASVCSGGCFPIAPAAQRIPQAFSSWRQAPRQASASRLSHSQAFGPHAGRPSAGACVQFQRGGLLQYASILTEAHTAARAWAPRAAQRAVSSWGAGE